MFSTKNKKIRKKLSNTYSGLLLNIHFDRDKVQHPKITTSFTNKNLDHLVFVDFNSFSSLISYYKISKEKAEKSKCNEQQNIIIYCSHTKFPDKKLTTNRAYFPYQLLMLNLILSHEVPFLVNSGSTPLNQVPFVLFAVLYILFYSPLVIYIGILFKKCVVCQERKDCFVCMVHAGCLYYSFILK
jgi:hypothetical protein